MNRIHLDHAATTPVAPQVLEEMLPYLTTTQGNPSSVHASGRTARAAMNGLFDLGRPSRVRMAVLIDRGHRELPIEASFVGRSVQTSDREIVEVRLKETDGEERVMLVERVE